MGESLIAYINDETRDFKFSKNLGFKFSSHPNIFTSNRFSTRAYSLLCAALSALLHDDDMHASRSCEFSFACAA